MRTYVTAPFELCRPYSCSFHCSYYGLDAGRKVNFWDELSSALEKHYHKEDAAKILQKYREVRSYMPGAD